MTTHFQKPENALKRAEELIAVGQKKDALQTLNDVINSRRHRTWQQTLEKIMIKYVQLCVELQKGKTAKDGLIQYRNISQHVNVPSVETVIKEFRDRAEERVTQAQSQANTVLVDVDDLEGEASPESIMLSSVTLDSSKDRNDREMVTPWLKFLWEAYKTILEILKANSKFEHIYHSTAQKAFEFCRVNKRTTEFRRLCDILRNHLVNLSKGPQHQHQQQFQINLSNPETLQLMLETRFAQLKVASELELWQESYRTAEDIHSLMGMSKKPIRASMLAMYYEKLSKIFWVSENYLFHAYAWFKYFTICKNQNKNLTEEDVKQMASCALLATLSIPLNESKQNQSDISLDINQEKHRRMAALLGFAVQPSRESLIAEMQAKHISELCLPELKNLYSLLEDTYHPLQICASVQPTLNMMSAHARLKQYVSPVQRLMLTRLLQQLSKVYKTVTLEQLGRLAPAVPFMEFEKSIVENVKAGHIQARVDYVNNALHFGSKDFESASMRSQLTTLSTRLQTVLDLMFPDKVKSEREHLKAAFYQGIAKRVRDEHKRVQERKGIIEQRKVDAEIRAAAQEKEDREREEIARKQREEIEAKRLAQESERREKERLESIHKEIKSKEVKQLIDEMKSKGGKVKVAGKSVDQIEEADLANLDADTLAEAKRKQAEKERKDRERVFKQDAKRLDHLERAKREEEKPLLQQRWQKQQVDDRKFYEETTAEFLKSHKEKYEADLAEKQRLVRMKADKAAFVEEVLAKRREEMERKSAEQEERLQKIRWQRKLERAKQRKDEWEAEEREEQERREREEAEKRMLEEADRARKEQEAEKQKAAEEYNSRMAKLNEIAEKQKQKELEIEARLSGAKKREEEEPRGDRDREAPRRLPERERERAEPEPWRRPGDRDRPAERDRDDTWRRPSDRDRQPLDREREREPARNAEPWRRPSERDRPAVDSRAAPEPWRRPGDRDRSDRYPEREKEREAGAGAGAEPWRRPSERERGAGERFGDRDRPREPFRRDERGPAPRSSDRPSDRAPRRDEPSQGDAPTEDDGFTVVKRAVKRP
eukprot:GILK01001667.1.p1 GENE.GILK01001667.1~~GILK01001667.1.p1  ORF type:complete len:1057 (-),score=306.94 GILK01001667.1:119-3289(-)